MFLLCIRGEVLRAGTSDWFYSSRRFGPSDCVLWV